MDDELEPVAAMPAPRMSPTAYVCRCGRVIDPVRSRRDLWHAVRCLGTESVRGGDKPSAPAPHAVRGGNP